MTVHRFFHRVYGGLIGSAIGDAMGGPVEMWSPADIARRHGWITTLLPYTHPPNPTYVWTPQAPAGTYTDDTRLKLLVAELTARHGRALTPRMLADEFIRRHDSAAPGTLEQAWFAEWAEVSRAFLTHDDPAAAVGMHSFYGGEIVCGGLITGLPLGFVFPGDPVRAYEAAFALAFFDIGYARDATAMMTALVSRCMRVDDASMLQAVEAAMAVNPYRLDTRQIFGRVCRRHAERALELARQAKTRQALIDAFHRVLLRATPCDPAEMLAIALGILVWTDGDPVAAIPLAVNVGRDNDSIAGIVGMAAGALYGDDALPAAWIETVEQANPEPDMRALALRVCHRIPGRNKDVPE